jgi:hypothetical protein
MYRSLVSASAALSLLVSTFISPAATYAKRCPDEPPSTLLSLYKKSDAIFVGTFDKTTVGDVVSEDEHSTMVKASDHYSISSTLKGTTQKFFVNTYEQYHYKGSDGTEEVEEEEGYGVEKVEPGDTVLLFLKFKAEDEENTSGKPGLEIVHYRDAVRPVKASEVSSYEARIRDLNGIFSGKKADDADILKWILRCIDDPVTRWDGAFELLNSFQSLEWKKQQEDEAKNKVENEESSDVETDAELTDEKIESSDADVEESHEMEAEEEEEIDTSAYASLLTAEQKDSLTNIAINLKPAKAEDTENSEDEVEKPTLSDGDRVLFELVKRWGDARLAAVMLDRLRIAGDNYEKADWMNSIAEVLKDGELKTAAEKFSEVSYREDDETVKVEKTETPEERTKDKREVEGPVYDTEPVSDESQNDIHDDPPEKTYKILRDEMLAQFIDRAQVVLTKEQEGEMIHLTK